MFFFFVMQEVRGSKTEGAGLFFLESLGYEPLKLREAALVSLVGTMKGVEGPRVLKQVSQ